MHARRIINHQSSIINHHQIDVLASCERDWGGPQRICRELPAVFQSGWTSTPRCITNTARQQHTAQHAIMRRCPNCPSTQPAARNPRTCCPGRALLPCDALPPVSLAATRLAERIVSPYPRGVLRAARFLRHIDIKSGRGGFPQPSSSPPSRAAIANLQHTLAAPCLTYPAAANFPQALARKRFGVPTYR